MSPPTDPHEKIAALEAEVSRLERALAERDAQNRTPVALRDEDPAVARLLGDRSLLSSLPDVISIIDREHRFLYLNRFGPGRRAEDIVGKCVFDFLEPDEAARRRITLECAWATGETQRHDTRSATGDVFATRVVPIMANGVVTHVLTTAVDVTEMKRVEEALAASELRLGLAIDAAEMAVWWSDARGSRWDDRLLRVAGIDPNGLAPGPEGLIPFVHPDDQARVVTSLARFREQGLYEELEFRVVRPDGETRHLLAKGTIVADPRGEAATYGAVFDVTDRKHLEERVRQAEKMDAIGRLTAGIAHNFNNILSIILSNAELCRRVAPSSLAPRLDDIVHAGFRGAEMIRGLMLFARDEGMQPMEAVDIGALVRRTVEICRTTFDRQIMLELDVAPSVPLAQANAGQMEQVILNLFINARDALDEAQPESPRILANVSRDKSGSVVIRVTDNGPGMDEATRARVFEPFFTTKAHKRGTGLGLSSAYAVVNEHGGRITCESRRGIGTTFEVVLPAANRGGEPVKASGPVSERRKTNATILLVDDEVALRKAMRKLLELEGYAVLEAGDGGAAIALLEARSPPVDAAIVDCSMPGLPGRVVLEKIAAVAPAVPVIVVSGHAMTTEVATVRAVLQKPVPVDTLLAAVASAVTIT